MKPLQSKKTIFFTIFLAIGLAAGACEGPEGPQGPQGEQGPEGPVGPAGSDGSMIYAGEGEPDGATGAAGDFYLDIASGSLYGPKTEDGWGAPVTLQGSEGPQGPAGEDGQDGVDGEDGSQILAGNGAPDNSLGKEADYYLDKVNFDLYGPKTGGEWGTPINLQGNANVVADTVTLSDTDWEDGQFVFRHIPTAVMTRPARVVTLHIPEISEEIFNLGMVQVYFDSSPNLWAPLPFQMLALGNEYHINLNYTYKEGELTLYYYYTTNDDGSIPPDVTAAEIPKYTFKYVITSANAIQSMSKNNIALENYIETMDYLNANFDIKRGKESLE